MLGIDALMLVVIFFLVGITALSSNQCFVSWVTQLAFTYEILDPIIPNIPFSVLSREICQEEHL